VLFRVSFNPNSVESVRRYINPLSLSASSPPSNTRLNVLGYPTDPFRSRRATVTESCWVNDGSDFYTQYNPTEIAQMQASPDFQEHLNDPVYQAAQNQLASSSGKFNCAVYGGNSVAPSSSRVHLQSWACLQCTRQLYIAGFHRRPRHHLIRWLILCAATGPLCSRLGFRSLRDTYAYLLGFGLGIYVAALNTNK